MTLSKIDVANMLTGATPVANGGTALTSGFKNGITMADAWRLTTAFSNDATPIASNWERNDAYGFGQLGTGMTQSSGIFTFPSTGIYRISFGVYIYYNGDDRLIEAKIRSTTDNSSYNTLTDAVSFVQQTGGALTYNNAYAEAQFDVTNTTTHKVRFDIAVTNSNTAIAGDSNVSATYTTFTRLGDT